MTPPLMHSSINGPIPGGYTAAMRGSGAASVARSAVRRSVPASYAYQSQSRSAPFSVHSRGVPIHDFSRFRDLNNIMWSTFRQLRDIGSSFFYLCMMQTSSTIFSVLLTIIAYFFFAYSKDTPIALSQGTLWSSVGFLIFLPSLGLVGWTFARREQALRSVATVKSLTLWIYLSHRDWVPPECLPDGHLAAVQQTLFNILGEMRGYLLPPRYYSTTFPYTGVRHKMMGIAQDRAKYVRRIASNFKKLSQYNEPLRRAGLDYAGLSKLTEYYMQLHHAFEEMANVKEYRTPLSLRTLTRFYLTVVIPLFFGPFYATATTSTAFNICLAIMVRCPGFLSWKRCIALRNSCPPVWSCLYIVAVRAQTPCTKFAVERGDVDPHEYCYHNGGSFRQPGPGWHLHRRAPERVRADHQHG